MTNNRGLRYYFNINIPFHLRGASGGLSDLLNTNEYGNCFETCVKDKINEAFNLTHNDLRLYINPIISEQIYKVVIRSDYKDTLKHLTRTSVIKDWLTITGTTISPVCLSQKYRGDISESY